MSLRKLYKIWALSLLGAFIISIFYVLISVYNLSSETLEQNAFALLPYFVYAHVLIVFCTGLFTALLIKFRKPHSPDKSRLVWAVFITHTGTVCLSVALLNYAWIYYFNPLAFAMFATLPYISWSTVQKRRNWRTLGFIASGIFLCILLEAWSWYKVFTFKP